MKLHNSNPPSAIPLDPHLARQILLTLGELALPAPGTLLGMDSLLEVHRISEEDLVEVLTAMERNGWLIRRGERHWELSLNGARRVEQALPPAEQRRARALRSQVLEALCRSDTAAQDLPVDYRATCAFLDAHGGEIRAAIRWLVAEGYLNWHYIQGYVSCTSAGKAAYQRTIPLELPSGRR